MEAKRKFTSNPPAINMTMVGFGQAGTRMVDKFAELRRHEDNTQVYNCLALNSNDGDLKELKYIPKNNQVSLALGGLGKNPERAIRVLETNEEAKDKLKRFITDRVRPVDDLVLFFAGLGGGTGTSTIIKAINEFNEHYNKPIIQEEFKKLQQTEAFQNLQANKDNMAPIEYKKNFKRFTLKAIKNAEEHPKHVKLGIVVTLPVRADGPDVLRQVNEFTQQIWKITKDPMKGVAFTIFADNQHFYDEFAQLEEKDRVGLKVDNFRDYANRQIRDVIHELNTATTGGGTSVTFDKEDFRRAILEHKGCLSINKLSKHIREVANEKDLEDLFMESFKGSAFHQPLDLVNKDEEGNMSAAKVYHAGLLSVLAKDKSFGSGFMDSTKAAVVEELPIKGTVFSGYLVGNNDFQVSAYSFFKTDALPTRLSKGLVNEYQEFMEKQRKISFKQDSIQSIAAGLDDDSDDLDLDLGEFGFDEEEVKPNKEGKGAYLDIDDVDLELLNDDED